MFPAFVRCGITCCHARFIVPLLWQLQRSVSPANWRVGRLFITNNCFVCNPYLQAKHIGLSGQQIRSQQLNTGLQYKSATQGTIHLYSTAWLHVSFKQYNLPVNWQVEKLFLLQIKRN
ncbi:hypothetical protein I5907_11115 [Panacibacter sp. DH6]|uniref:Uncharacterized protein n=1 Tax=Panacibacter microcysteis TaxID=2793269 RepID=A0A931E7N7_9BACT|nr:hypothetical protein [Panacibacter microcysteis]MBG9376790.1 hypothetical protein [Panacibacter microcysteis]